MTTKNPFPFVAPCGDEVKNFEDVDFHLHRCTKCFFTDGEDAKPVPTNDEQSVDTAPHFEDETEQ